MYDYVFVTHLPSFYKVNLYNELSKKLKIMVVFIGRASNIRTQDFVQSEFKFDHVFLTENSFETRSTWISLYRFFCFILKKKYQKMVLGGWDLPEFWLALFLNHVSKNALALESTENESATSGIKGFVKRQFLSRVSTVFASGQLHSNLLYKLNYQGVLKITRGVGLIHKPQAQIASKLYEKKFLYIGRLSTEKNLFFLLDVFKSLPECELLIVGAGPLKSELTFKASANVKFMDHVENQKIGKLFELYDFLILPSLSEPWGLVVEESLYYGRPVLISERCGASELIHSDHGFKFDPQSSDQLKKIIISINDEVFQKLQKNVQKISLDEKDQQQINSYLI